MYRTIAFRMSSGITPCTWFHLSSPYTVKSSHAKGCVNFMMNEVLFTLFLVSECLWTMFKISWCNRYCTKCNHCIVSVLCSHTVYLFIWKLYIHIIYIYIYFEFFLCILLEIMLCLCPEFDLRSCWTRKVL